jgi:hypothetical protein
MLLHPADASETANAQHTCARARILYPQLQRTLNLVCPHRECAHASAPHLLLSAEQRYTRSIAIHQREINQRPVGEPNVAHDRLWGDPSHKLSSRSFRSYPGLSEAARSPEQAMVHCCALQSTFPSWFLLRKNTPKGDRRKRSSESWIYCTRHFLASRTRGDLRKVILASFQLFTFFYTVLVTNGRQTPPAHTAMHMARVQKAEGAVVSHVVFEHELRAGTLGSPTAAKPRLIEGTKCIVISRLRT